MSSTISYKKISLALAIITLFIVTGNWFYQWYQQAYAVDLIIHNGTLVRMHPKLNEDEQVIHSGAIAIRGNKIIAVGTATEILQKYSAIKKMNVYGDIIMPGLINGHTHAAMTLMRGIADDYELHEWLEKHIFPIEKNLGEPDFVYWGAKLGCLEMIQGGITTAVDMYFHEERAAQAFNEMGMRAIVGQSIFTKEDIATAEALIKKWRGHHLITPAVAPHAPHTCPEPVLIEAKKMSDAYQVPYLIHIAETAREVDTLHQRYNLTPVAYLEKIKVLSNSMIAAHLVKVTDADIGLLYKRGVGVIHNPVSNMKLASGIAPIEKMVDLGVAVGLGTDGAASNNSLDMIAEIKMAALLQKVFTQDPRAISAYQAIQLATIEGARAIHQAHLIGSLEAGKRADIIIVDTTQTHSVPIYNIFSQLVYATKASDIKSVMIDGNFLVINKKLQYPASVTETLTKKVIEYQKMIKKYVTKHTTQPKDPAKKSAHTKKK